LKGSISEWRAGSLLVCERGFRGEKPVSKLRSRLRPRGSEDGPLRHDPEGIAKRGEKPVSKLRSRLRPRGSEDGPLRHDPEGIAKRGVATPLIHG
ncbi:hypothetical protein P9761_25100, partial [Brevibacillus centrosporus]|uniref:hypothetical protein n=1 Tax=Brevibacillus centrosporus TaxID=54910 RepID=UPI002E1C5F45|nr:hypothetical protein [Brevibacillus centrosporus]